MAEAPELQEVFTQVTRDALKTMISTGVGAGLELGWCLDKIDSIVTQLRKEAEGD